MNLPIQMLRDANSSGTLKFTENTVMENIQKGQLNKIRMRPQVITEQQESSRVIQGTVTSSNIVGQVFRASQDNINTVMLTLASAESFTALDDFESYANSAALQAEWAEVSNVATLETVIISPNNSSTQSMRMPTQNPNDSWTDTIVSTDLTGVTFSFDWTQTQSFNNQQLEFFIGDGTNTKAITIVTNGPLVWRNFSIAETSLTEDQVGITDTTAITKIGFRILLKRANEFVYVDNLSYQSEPGSVELKLFNLGSELPRSGQMKINEGTQYTSIGDLGISGLQESSCIVELQGSVRLYHCDGFIAGVAKEIPSNVTLTRNNYYAITVNYVDTDVSVYGSDPTFNINYYQNGYAFTAPDEDTAFLRVGENNDMMFAIFSSIKAYVQKCVFRFNEPPGKNAELTVYAEDINMRMCSIFINHEHEPAQEEIVDATSSPAILEPGSKFELYYSDDPFDDVTSVVLEIETLYTEPFTHG